MTDKEIALRLGVLVATIRTQRVYRENHVHSRARAAILWVESGRPASW